VAYVQETENLRKQLEIMQESNKRLHDANDDLRSAVENSLSQPTRRPTAAVSTFKFKIFSVVYLF
jgi:regulator of replication initiation timing